MFNFLLKKKNIIPFNWNLDLIVVYGTGDIYRKIIIEQSVFGFTDNTKSTCKPYFSWYEQPDVDCSLKFFVVTLQSDLKTVER